MFFLGGGFLLFLLLRCFYISRCFLKWWIGPIFWDLVVVVVVVVVVVLVVLPLLDN